MEFYCRHYRYWPEERRFHYEEWVVRAYGGNVPNPRPDYVPCSKCVLLKHYRPIHYCSSECPGFAATRFTFGDVTTVRLRVDRRVD